MTISKLLLIGVCIAGLSACGDKETPSHTHETPVTADTPAVNAPGTSYADAPSGTYALDKTHAYIMFHYDHQGFSKPFVRWGDWNSTLNWDNETPDNSSVNVTIQTASIDTGVDVFDGHLNEERWFDSAKHPEITFKSTSLTKTSDHTGTMTGDLTMKGITKPVTLNVNFNKAAEGREAGNYKIGFSARGQVMRSDWDLGAYTPVVSDAVELMIEVEYGLTK
ncbi:MAG: YceI family protein [Alphaproteobacteria bacterium]